MIGTDAEPRHRLESRHLGCIFRVECLKCVIANDDIAVAALILGKLSIIRSDRVATRRNSADDHPTSGKKTPGDFVALADALRASRLDLSELISLALQLAQIIAAVHRAGVIHKDINPANILLCGVERKPMLIDYDLATTFAEERPGFIPANEIA